MTAVAGPRRDRAAAASDSPGASIRKWYTCLPGDFSSGLRGVTERGTRPVGRHSTRPGRWGVQRAIPRTSRDPGVR